MKTRSDRTVLHPDQEQAFRSGLASMFRQWTVLELAVHNQWGGASSGDKALILQDEILDLFRAPEKVYKDDIALILEDFLESELNTICEDGSPDEIGEIICKMWRECVVGDYATVERTLNQERIRSGVIASSIGMEAGDIVLSDDEVEPEDSAKSAALAEAVAAAVGATGEDLMEVDVGTADYIAPVVDEEGFETISRKSRRSTKPK